jgi:hypothetical protein
MKQIYLSGPMTGYKQYNFPAFDFASAKLRALPGVEFVFSPADNDRKYGLTGETNVPFPPGVTVRTLLKDDTAYLCDHADTIAMLPGWEQSPGANAEYNLAKALGLSILVLGKEYIAPKPGPEHTGV